MIKLLIIADDITGALDVAVPFSKKGIKAFVTSDINVDLASIDDHIEVLSVNTETRHLKKDEAYERVYAATKNVAAQCSPCVYKKTDSALRGNIGAELKGMMDALGAKRLCFVPAFPRLNRVTKSGKQYIDGVLLEHSHYADDPFEPATTSSTEEIVRRGANLSVRCVTEKERNSFTQMDDDGVYIFDAETDKDLAEIGGILFANSAPPALAGCAGFAETLPSLLPFAANADIDIPTSRNILIVAGSVSKVTIEQANYARLHGVSGSVLTFEQRFDPAYPSDTEGGAFIDTVSRALSKSGSFIMQSVEDPSRLTETEVYLKKYGLSHDELPERVAYNIGRLVTGVMKKKPVDTLVVFGGDTLLGILKELGCSGLVPKQEIMPGVVLSLATGFIEKPLTIVSKSGGFGDKNALISILSYLRESK